MQFHKLCNKQSSQEKSVDLYISHLKVWFMEQCVPFTIRACQIAVFSFTFIKQSFITVEPF